ncbi:MAG: biotin--[acetyl-CoA-carboxylase] ligase [Thermoplasmata archaeon]
MSRAEPRARILRFDSLESTNKKARELAEAGEPEGTVVVARIQTGGRGRMGRRWFSPPGGLWFSVVLRPQIPPAQAPVLGLLTGVAVARALKGLYRLESRLKWPNDVLIQGKKVCGVLTELSVRGEILDHVIVGVGINASFPLALLPSELWARTTTIQELLGRTIELEPLLYRVVEELDKRYLEFVGGKTRGILEEWRALSETLGRKVRVDTLEEAVEGLAEDIDASGALLIKTAKGPVRVMAGDCVHLE